MKNTFCKNKSSFNNFQPIQKIGLFDSGVGGVSILKPLMQALPKKEFFYYADNLNWPYGNKTTDELKKYCHSIQDFLIFQGAEVLVIACNTASSLFVGQPYYKNTPLINVIEPTTTKAIQKTKNNRVGILATQGTIESQVYSKCLLEKKSDLKIFQNPSPLLSAFVENKLHQQASCQKLVKEYLTPLLEKNIDTLILGCTHYSGLIGEIQSAIHPSVQIVDSSIALVEKLLEKSYSKNKQIKHNSTYNHHPQKTKCSIYTSKKDDDYLQFTKQFIQSHA